MSEYALSGEHDAFRRHYEDPTSHWGNSSGPGSDSFYTADYRSFLSKFVRLNNISSVVDIGCGDWRFSRFIDFFDAAYLGLDIVESVVIHNSKLFSSEKVSFRVMPTSLMDVPSGDLLVMKDVLQHLSISNILLMSKILFPKFKYCLLANSFRKLDTPQNIEIVDGEFRCLDLASAPFNLSGAYVLEFPSPVWEHIRVFLHQAGS